MKKLTNKQRTLLAEARVEWAVFPSAGVECKRNEWRTAKALEARGLIRCEPMSETGHFLVYDARLPNDKVRDAASASRPLDASRE